MSRSLERRLGLALLSFGAALAVTYLVVVPQVAFKTEDTVLLRLAAQQLERVQADHDAVLPAPMFRLAERPDLTEAIAERLLALPNGVHELNDVVLTTRAGETDLIVAVAQAADPAAIICHDVAALEAFDERLDAPGYFTLIALGAVISLGLALYGLVTARRVFRSLRSLGRLMATEHGEGAATILASFDDDVQVLRRYTAQNGNQETQRSA